MTLIVAMEAPAQPASDCALSGRFVFTLADGFGFLSLTADGAAEMVLIPRVEGCETCQVPSRLLTGTYQTPRFDGLCHFILNLADPVDRRNIGIAGVVAFQGAVLMFQNATQLGLGAGLALRSDTLLQAGDRATSLTRPQGAE